MRGLFDYKPSKNLLIWPKTIKWRIYLDLSALSQLLRTLVVLENIFPEDLRELAIGVHKVGSRHLDRDRTLCRAHRVGDSGCHIWLSARDF
jgi:hypothetical protein